MYGLLQLQLKTHSVLLRLAARRAGSLDSFGNCPQRRLVRHRHQSGYHRGWLLPNKDYTYPQHRPLAATAEDGAARELISHSDTTNQQRLRLWVPQEINPLWRLEQDCGDGCKIGLHPLSHQFTPVSCLFRPCQSFNQLS